MHSTARLEQVAFFWDVYAQAYVMIGNCCIWLTAVVLLRPFNAECASSLAKFMCFFRNGIGLFSFLLAVKLSQDADNRVQDGEFTSRCNIALLALMSCCLLLDLWPLTEVADGALHCFKKRLSKHKSRKDGKKEKLARHYHEASPDPPTPPLSAGRQVPRRPHRLHHHLRTHHHLCTRVVVQAVQSEANELYYIIFV